MIKKMLAKMGYHKIEPTIEAPAKKERPRQVKERLPSRDIQQEINDAWERNFKKAVHPAIAMDSDDGETFAMDNNISAKAPYLSDNVLTSLQVLWYASQSFIGYQLCALLAQNWLVSKACLMPAKDATRNGYEITVNDGTEVDAAVLDAIREKDVEYRLNHNLIEFVQMGRVFGIRIAMFVVESSDPDYYKNPFNPDGIEPNSYKGIAQIDPYWITPQLDAEAAGNPASINFYEPTWWVVNGKPIHRTHLVIFRTEEVADVLKPSYIYGGVSVPQKIAERVYAAERVANEAPILAMTKRTDVVKADLTQATAEYDGFVERINQWVFNRDNYGVKFLGLDEEMQQFDTSLSDIDDVIMTQYQLVAAASNVPATKLLGSSPKGFNATGESEEANYHEELESIQSHDLTPLIQRHHLLLIRSEICHQFNIAPFHTTIAWNELDAMTAKEQSELNRSNADAGKLLVESGAISPDEERQRVISDPNSGYAGLQASDIPDDGYVFSDPDGA